MYYTHQTRWCGAIATVKRIHTEAIAILGLLAASISACAAETQEEWIVPDTEELDCTAWAEVQHRGAVYFNNVWNVQAAADFPWTQCIVRDPENSERLGFQWKWPESGSDIYAQPQVKIGMSPWDPVPRSDDRFPVGIQTIEAMKVTSKVEVNGPSEYNIVTTLWLTDSPAIITKPRPDSIVAEVMIWTYATVGHLSPAGTKIGSVVHDGVAWDVWLEENWHDVSGANDSRWIYVAFVSKNPGLSADFDPGALLRSEPVEALNLDEAYIADIELGAEVMRGEALLWVDQRHVGFDPR